MLTRVRNAGLTPEQVQVIWHTEADKTPTAPFPAHAQTLQAESTRILQHIRRLFPNVQQCFRSGAQLRPAPRPDAGSVDLLGPLSLGGRHDAASERRTALGLLGLRSGRNAPVAGWAVASALPNPFRPSLAVPLHLDRQGRLRADVYAAAGRLVRTLADEFRSAGSGRVVWAGRDASGFRVPDGVYFVRVEVAGTARTVKVVARR